MSVDTFKHAIARMRTEKTTMSRNRLSGAGEYHDRPRGSRLTDATSPRPSAVHLASMADATVAVASTRSTTPARLNQAEVAPSMAVLPSIKGACVSGTQRSGL